MNEYESQWRRDQLLEERIRGYLPAIVAVLLGLAIGIAISASEGWLIPTGVFLGILVLIAAVFKSEWALLVITILAPLEIWTQKIGSLAPGTGLTAINLVVIVLVVGAWLQRFSTSEASVEATSVDKPLLLYLAWSGLALYVAFMRWPNLDAKAAGEWLAMACGYVMYWVVRRRWRSDKLAVAAVWSVLALVVFEACFVMWQTHDQNITAYSEKLKYALTGTFPEGNSNDIGTYLSSYCMIGLGLFLAMRRSVWRWPALAAFVVGGLGTFFTYSRGSYIALGVGVLAVILYKHKRYLVPAVIVVMLLPYVLPASVVERMNTSGDKSAENRKEFWKNGLSLMLTNPLGVGWRGYAQNETARGQELKDPHSQYVLVAAEQGIVGISLFIILLVAAGKETVKAIKRARTPFVQGLGVGVFGALISFAVNNAFGTRMIWFYSVQHFWLLLGLLMVLSRRIPGESVVVEEAPAEKLKAVSPWRYRSWV
ncbi:MAG TPA: O-antigen ligase family protein [Armatimonadota bacterium]|jgi:O-antigen ligase